MKRLFFCLLLATLLLALIVCVLGACTASNINSDNLVGVWWHLESYGSPIGIDDSYVAMYITDDGNLFVLYTFPTSAGHKRDTFHFKYGFTDGILSIVPDSKSLKDIDIRRYNIEKMQITIKKGKLLLDMWDICDRAEWVKPEDTSYTLIKVADEIPYGWTDVDRQEIQVLNDRIHEITVVFVQRFSDALGLPILDSDIRFVRGIPTIAYAIEDIPIEIGFIGDTPSPREPQPYKRNNAKIHNVSLHLQHLSNAHIELLSSGYIPWNEVRSKTDQFALFYDWDYEIPEEWVVIFNNLDDKIEW